ncbi:MAG: PLP-dependent transferase, partial [Anaerovoracaceae bacterium]|nr:PLP-dependent transferase [Anaerovoracaceae bacterium]
MTNYKFNTNCVHAGYKAGSGDPHVLPIVQSTTYRYYNAADVAALFDLESDQFMYARIGHPDEDALEKKLA